MGLYLINLKKDFNKKTKMNIISQVFAIGDIHGCNSLLKKIHYNTEVVVGLAK